MNPQPPQFPVRYLGTRHYKSFATFWEMTAGTTYETFQIWFKALNGILNESNAPHVKMTYKNPHADKVETGGVWKYHNTDAFGKSVTADLKNFLTKCGLTPDFVKNKKDGENDQ